VGQVESGVVDIGPQCVVASPRTYPKPTMNPHEKSRLVHDWLEQYGTVDADWNAIGLATSLLGDGSNISPHARQQRLKQACASPSFSLYSFGSLAWMAGATTALQALHELGHGPYSISPDFDCAGTHQRNMIGQPWILCAIERKNAASIAWALERFNPADPITWENPSSADRDPAGPMGWLAWALFHGSWKTAKQIWKDPRIQSDASQASEGLFALMAGLIRDRMRIDLNQSNYLAHAGRWLQRLLAAGADPKQSYPLFNRGHAANVVSYGPLTGLPNGQCPSRSGWAPSQTPWNPLGWSRPAPVQSPYSAHELFWDSLPASQDEPGAIYGLHYDKSYLAREGWDRFRVLGFEVFGAADISVQQDQALRHVRAAMCKCLLGQLPHLDWPSWMRTPSAWARLSTQKALSIQSPENPDCLWLELAALATKLHMAGKNCSSSTQEAAVIHNQEQMISAIEGFINGLPAGLPADRLVAAIERAQAMGMYDPFDLPSLSYCLPLQSTAFIGAVEAWRQGKSSLLDDALAIETVGDPAEKTARQQALRVATQIHQSCLLPILRHVVAGAETTPRPPPRL
jgi:hypothetical protein